ncbi:MAG TPA: biotin/lipoyl-binding carrier protein [Candidatus Dormibacteraeota bacterium]|nr:biotin/lipoyl-binding carrier protein [Candidatus Dormibacteraeota bacterium]
MPRRDESASARVPCAPPVQSEHQEAGMAEVKAELVGNLWKIVTEVGQQVEEDDTLMILESMKMEIPITSPINGTVTQILVAEGDVVQEGQTVAVVE